MTSQDSGFISRISNKMLVALMGPMPSFKATTDISSYSVPAEADGVFNQDRSVLQDPNFMGWVPSKDKPVGKIKVPPLRDKKLVAAFVLPMCGAAAVTVVCTVVGTAMLVGGTTSSWPGKSMVLAVKVPSRENADHTPVIAVQYEEPGIHMFHVQYHYEVPIVGGGERVVRVTQATNPSASTSDEELQGALLSVFRPLMTNQGTWVVHHGMTGHVKVATDSWEVASVKYKHVLVKFHGVGPRKFIVPSDGGRNEFVVEPVEGKALAKPLRTAVVHVGSSNTVSAVVK